MMERPYLTLDELIDVFGIASRSSAYNSIARQTFPVPTYKIGKHRVADKAVVEAFFDEKRAEGLREFTTKS